MEIASDPVRQHQGIEADEHFALRLDTFRGLAFRDRAVDVTAAGNDDLPCNGDRRDGFEINVVALLRVLGIERVAQCKADVRAARDYRIGRGGSRLLDQFARRSVSTAAQRSADLRTACEYRPANLPVGLPSAQPDA